MHTRKIPSGTVLRVPAFDRERGIIDVRIGNETIGVYIEDLRERADVIES